MQVLTQVPIFKHILVVYVGYLMVIYYSIMNFVQCSFIRKTRALVGRSATLLENPSTYNIHIRHIGLALEGDYLTSIFLLDSCRFSKIFKLFCLFAKNFR